MNADAERHLFAQFSPIAVARRSGVVESVHHGAGVVVDADGVVRPRIGDPSTPVYLRSSLKIFQTEAMLDAGLDLPDQLLALVAASHSGERRHLDGVVDILRRHDLSPEDLRNTPTLPYGPGPRAEAIREGDPPSSLFQNCSGKHAGMLATCRVNGWPIDDYLDPDHPLQRHIASSIEALGTPVCHTGVDGCGAPTFVLPLDAAARALARLAVADSAVLHAMRAHPEMVGGAGRDVTEWMIAVPGLAAKDGAAGVLALVMAAGARRGWAAVYKVADGSDDVRRAVAATALTAMGVLDPDDGRPASTRVPVVGGGAPVGEIEPIAWD